jgi:hypothetical protein
MRFDVLEFLVVGWCASYLLATVGLALWFSVELKVRAARILARRRRGALLPRARIRTVSRRNPHPRGRC